DLPRLDIAEHRIILGFRGSEEEMDEAPRFRRDGETAERLRLVLEPHLESLVDPPGDHVQYSEGCGEEAVSLRHHLLPCLAHDHSAYAGQVLDPLRGPAFTAGTWGQTAVGELEGRGPSALLEDGRGYHLVHEADPACPAAVQLLAGEHQVESGTDADEAREALRSPCPGQQPELHFR